MISEDTEPNDDKAKTLTAQPAGRIHANAAHQQPHDTSTIDGYTIIREVARGGQGVVFECVRKTTGRRVAVKVLTGGRFITPLKKARFDREVQILAGLDHSNIVGVIDRGSTSDGSLFLVMDFIDGRPLDQFMNRYYQQHPEGPPPTDPSELLQLFIRICDAVNAAHLKGVVHRDLKPSNIRITEIGEPYILDFGLARWALAMLDENVGAVSMTGEFMGTIAYASPEQAEGHNSKVDTRTDVYSLGVILYQMITRRFPYEVSGTVRDVLNNIVRSEPVPPSRLFSSNSKLSRIRKISRLHLKDGVINPTLEAVILKALSKQRNSRYQNAGDFSREMTNYLSGRATVAGAERQSSPMKRAFKYTAASIVVCAGLCSGIWRLNHGRHRQGNAAITSVVVQNSIDPIQYLARLEEIAVDSKRMNPNAVPQFTPADLAFLEKVRTGEDPKAKITASILLADGSADALLDEYSRNSFAEIAMFTGKRWFLDKRSHFDKAIPFFEQAMDLQPNSVGARQFLAESLTFARLGISSQNKQRAVEICETTLKMVAPNSIAWASTQIDLGNAYSALPANNRADCLQKAMNAYQAAAVVYTLPNDRTHWAMIQNSLGLVWVATFTGNRAQNLTNAVSEYNLALTVRTRADEPIHWAATQNNLGIALADLAMPGDRVKNLQNAISAIRAALEVRNTQNDPIGWAASELNLASAILSLPTQHPDRNINSAFTAINAAQTVYTRDVDPSNWAMTQIVLANAWQAMNTDNSLENAIAAYRAALEVYTKENDPIRWAAAENNLGYALAASPHDDGSNLPNAIACLKGAALVYSELGNSSDHARVLDELSRLERKYNTTRAATTQPFDPIRAAD